jgi:hypothetical protein
MQGAARHRDFVTCTSDRWQRALFSVFWEEFESVGLKNIDRKNYLPIGRCIFLSWFFSAHLSTADSPACKSTHSSCSASAWELDPTTPSLSFELIRQMDGFPPQGFPRLHLIDHFHSAETQRIISSTL